MKLNMVQRISKKIIILAPLLLSGCGDSKFGINIPDVANMMETLQKNYAAIEMLIFGVAYVAGFALLLSAVYKLRAYGQVRTMMPSNAQLAGPLIQFSMAIALIFLPSIVTISVTSLWGSNSLLAWPGGGDNWDKILSAVFGMVRILGYIALVRGIILLSRASQPGAQQGTFGKGMTHLIGGIFAINIWGTVTVLSASFGILLSK